MLSLQGGSECVIPSRGYISPLSPKQDPKQAHENWLGVWSLLFFFYMIKNQMLSIFSVFIYLIW